MSNEIGYAEAQRASRLKNDLLEVQGKANTMQTSTRR